MNASSFLRILASVLKIAFNERYVHALPLGHRFPMSKYELIPEQLKYEGLVSAENFFSPGKADDQVILLTHERNYWENLRNLTLPPQAIRRTGFPLSLSLVERELHIVQGTIESCRYALKYGVSFNVAGGTHHAGSHWGEGFCLLNDQAVAANFLLKEGLASSVLMIDLDVHQGNGTAQIFEHNPQVFTFSMHSERNFPFRKERSNWDIGLDNGTEDNQYLYILEKALDRLFIEVRPDFVFFLAGVDVLSTDKLGHLALSRQGCRERDRMVFQYCHRHNVPVQVSMGGGYSTRIADIVEAHCNTFREAVYQYF